jgi:hypothetical protein
MDGYYLIILIEDQFIAVSRFNPPAHSVLATATRHAVQQLEVCARSVAQPAVFELQKMLGELRIHRSVGSALSMLFALTREFNLA